MEKILKRLLSKKSVIPPSVGSSLLVSVNAGQLGLGLGDETAEAVGNEPIGRSGVVMNHDMIAIAVVAQDVADENLEVLFSEIRLDSAVHVEVQRVVVVVKAVLTVCDLVAIDEEVNFSVTPELLTAPIHEGVEDVVEQLLRRLGIEVRDDVAGVALVDLTDREDVMRDVSVVTTSVVLTGDCWSEQSTNVADEQRVAADGILE